MDQLNTKIFDTFKAAIDSINVGSTLESLTILSNLSNSDNISAGVQLIQTDLRLIQTRFDTIANSTPTLPTNLVNQTIASVSIKKAKII